MKILVVDDDLIIHTILKSHCETLNHDYMGLFNGNDAANTVKMNDINLVMLDIFMDEKEGLATLRELKTYIPEVPVYAMSSDEFYLDLANNIGACGYLVKPFTLDDFQDVIDGKSRNCIDCRVKRTWHGKCGRQYSFDYGFETKKNQ